MTALAFHYTQSGRIKEGLVKFIRCKDYCMSTRQATEVCWEICVRAIHAKNYSCAKDHVTRLERSSDPSARAASLRTSGGGGGGTGVVATSISSDPQASFTSQLQVVKGLLALVEGLFLNISGGSQSQFTNLLSAEDVAIYGGLLGLTTLHRDKLNSLVMNDVVYHW
jgi:COP9 signalosome complex subunit 1